MAFMASMEYCPVMKQVSLAEARDRLSALVNDAAHGGQRIVLASRGRPKAALIGMKDLERLERTETGVATVAREMLRWIERVEKTQRRWPRVKRSSTEALREVREEDHAGRDDLPRRQPRAQAPRRRGG
jgi:prevent-host-death family protein